MIIDAIEALLQENKINADADKVYSVIEKIANKRSVSYTNDSICKITQSTSLIGTICDPTHQLQSVEDIANAN